MKNPLAVSGNRPEKNWQPWERRPWARHANAECGMRSRPSRYHLLFPLFLSILCFFPSSLLAFEQEASTTADTSLTARTDTVSVANDTLRTDTTQVLQRRKTFVEGMRSIFLFGARQLVLLDSTLTIPADSTEYDSTLIGQVGGGALYLSRRLYVGVVYTFRYGVAAVEPERILQLKDFFDIPKSPWGWYPIIVGTSYYRVKLGAKLYYRSPTYGGSAEASAAGLDKWSSRVRMTLRNASEQQVRQMNVTLMRREDDDMLYYGFGPNPEKDPRSHFKPGTDEEYGVFHHDLQQGQVILGLRTGRNYEFRGTWILQRREIFHDLERDNSLNRVFDVDALPGGKGVLRDIYQEIAFRFDNTSGQEGRGLAMELYGGVADGLGDGRQFLRYGIDTHAYIRMFRSHYLVPRLVTNVVRNLASETPLAFTDYPRHPTFRAASDRKIVRSDNIVMVPALDIHNRLTPNITARVFTDYLLATPSLDKLQAGRGVVGVGMGLVLYTSYADVAGIIVSYSELGPRLSLFVGTEPNRNERSRWR